MGKHAPSTSTASRPQTWWAPWPSARRDWTVPRPRRSRRRGETRTSLGWSWGVLEGQGRESRWKQVYKCKPLVYQCVYTNHRHIIFIAVCVGEYRHNWVDIAIADVHFHSAPSQASMSGRTWSSWSVHPLVHERAAVALPDWFASAFHGMTKSWPLEKQLVDEKR